MIGTVSVPTPDPVLADRIRSAVPRDDEGAQTYLEVGARLDVVSAVHAEAGGVAWRSLHATWDRPWIIAMGQDPPPWRDVSWPWWRRVACLRGSPWSAGPSRTCRPGFVPSSNWSGLVVHEVPPTRARRRGRGGRGPCDDLRIPELLAVASPDAMIRLATRDPGLVGRPLGSLGTGARADAEESAPRADDPLIAIAAVTSMRPGIPHLGSVATHPDWRGRGLSRDLCAR